MQAVLFVGKMFWAALLIVPLAAQPQQVVWTNYTTNGGLPANVVYGVLQSRDGYLWFTTEAGICRFNGYEFVRPVDTSMWNGAEAFQPTEDPRGRIWFARLDGSLWYVQRDTVHPFAHKARMEAFRRQYQLLIDMHADADGSLWLAYNHLGLLHLYPDGRFEVVRGQDRRVFLYAEINGRAITPVISSDSVSDYTTAPLGVAVYRQGAIQYLSTLPRRPFADVHQRGHWRLRNGDVLHAHQNTYYLLRNDSVVWQTRSGYTARRLAETAEGGILLAVHMGQHPGLFYFPSIEHLRRGQGQNLLPGCFVTDVLIDRWGGWWATTHHTGVFYCKNPDVKVFDRRQGLPSDEVTRLAFDGKSRLFVGFRPAALAVMDLQSGRITTFSLPQLASRDVEALLYDTVNAQLWCSTPLHFWQSGRWHTAGHLKRGTSLGAKTLSLGPRSGHLWSASSAGFFEVESTSGLGWHRSDSEETLPYTRTFDVAEDAEGTVWVITHTGLHSWREGRYELPPFSHPALRFQPRHLRISPGGKMAIGLRGAGVLLRDEHGQMTHLRQADGLASDLTMRLSTGPAEVFYVSSNEGFTRLIPRPGGRWEAQAITRREGLPSDQVSDIVDAGGYLWVATHRGLVRFRHLPTTPPVPPPTLERLWVNHRPATFVPHGHFPHNSNTLRLRFYTLHYPSEGNIRYRYRLLGADTTFAYSTTREVLLANLAHGQYTFEVQAQGPSGQWSTPTRWHFHIRPAWWQTPAFWMLLSLSIAIALSLIYRWRLHQKHQQAAALEKIRQLETAALRAQMNPHFIFNCLNSIQHFITENNAEAAAHYLSSFARLVRLALHGAVDGRHSLCEEIEMLSHYLALEQLRFSQRFDYSIAVNPELDLDDISLPPLLVQPFVENALLHGLQNKEKGGLISIAFAAEDRYLIATITDNGPGLTAADGVKSPHKSVGMMLTQRRLALLSEKARGDAKWENLTHPDGSPAGLRVTLHIPLDT
jgi:ligand-binding sensor domain-containing protein